MRYYKLLTKWWYPNSCFIIDKIYPKIFKQNEDADQLSVLEMQQAYPNDWQEVPAGDYFVQEGKMPEYFAIKRVVNNPLWKKYIDWMNIKYNHTFDGSASWYGFDGSTNYSDMFWGSLNKFKNTPIELTLEQWDQIVNKKQKVMNKEIIGWKLKENCNQYKQAALTICNTVVNWENSLMTYDISIKQTGYITRLEKAEVLKLWFEPVYSQKFKIGDWVKVEKFPGYWSSLLNNNSPENIKYPVIGQITKMQENGDHTGIELCNYGFNLTVLINKNIIKLATPEEIKAAQFPQITINGYKGEFFDEYVKFRCAIIDKDVFILLYESKGGQSNRDIEYVTIGKETFTKEQIKQIAEYYLNKK